MLLRQSEADIRLARYAISTGDAYMCDIAIFHCQQAHERLLKHILPKYGGMGENDESIRTHDMAVLIGFVERRTGFYVPDRLKELADDLTCWRIEARYGNEHVGSLAVAADLIRCYENIRDELERKTYDRVKPSNVFTGKREMYKMNIHVVAEPMKYREYEGSVEYSEDDGCYYGSVQGIKSLLLYEGGTVAELRRRFESVVDDYILTCSARGVTPEKP